MKLAIYARTETHVIRECMSAFFGALPTSLQKVAMVAPLLKFLPEKERDRCLAFEKVEDLPFAPDMLISIGGDGTFLDAVQLVIKKNVPIAGINVGRMGFLARFEKSQMKYNIEALLSQKINRVSCPLLRSELQQDKKILYSLNEMAVRAISTDTTLQISVSVNGIHLNSYVADGFLIATPIGSTAYNMSVGGPIMEPGADSFIATPIAAHNLNVRPVILNANHEISVTVSSHSGKFRLLADSMSYTSENQNIAIRKAEEKVTILQPMETSSFDCWRSRLGWGNDIRIERP